MGTCHLMGITLVALVADNKIAFKPGFVAAHGGQVSPVNSSYKLMRGDWEYSCVTDATANIKSQVFMVNICAKLVNAK